MNINLLHDQSSEVQKADILDEANTLAQESFEEEDNSPFALSEEQEEKETENPEPEKEFGFKQHEPEQEETGFADSRFTSIYDEHEKPPKKKTGLFILVIALFVVAIASAYYFLIYQPKQKSQPSFPPPQEIAIDTSEAVTNQPNETITSPISGEGTLTDFEKEIQVSVQGGVNTIKRILNTLPKDVTISVLTYHGDRSLNIQVLANTATQLNEYFQLLSNEFRGATLEKSEIESRTVNGRPLKRLTITSSGFDSAQPLSAGNIQILEIPQFRTRIEQISRDSGLRVESITGGTRSFSDNKVIRTPFTIKLSGSQNSGLQFLNNIVAARLNIKFSKIMILSSDSNVPSNGTIDLILYIDLVKQG